MKSQLPVMLVAVAQDERLPFEAICHAFDMTRAEANANLVFFRDLLVSRARELGYVHPEWTLSKFETTSWLRELSFAVSGKWTVLLTPREIEERRHLLFVLNHLKRVYTTQARRDVHG